MKKFINFIPFIALLTFATGCSTTDEKKQVAAEKPAEEYYTEALTSLKSGQYKKAAKSFDEVEKQHPYSIWATKSSLMSAYAQYQRNEYDDAIVGLNRFIKLHPGNKDVDYAYYLKALSYYEQISDVERDQQMTLKALSALKDVVKRFPNSDYAKDSKLKLDLVKDHLAGKEITVGRYYLKKGNATAAINRFLKVIQSYQTTSHVPEALHRLSEAYTSLGMKEEATKTAAVLGHNFPNNEWYKDSYYLVKDMKKPKEKGNRKWLGWLF